MPAGSAGGVCRCLGSRCWSWPVQVGCCGGSPIRWLLRGRRGCGSGPEYISVRVRPPRWRGSARFWDRCTAQNWRPGWSGVGWTIRRTPAGARSANRRSPQCRHRGGQGRSPEPCGTSTSWACVGWPPMSWICGQRSPCWSSDVRCAPVSRKPSPVVVVAGRGGGVGIGRQVSGFRRPGAWRSCVSDSSSRRRRGMRAGPRSLWAANGCGVTAPTWLRQP